MGRSVGRSRIRRGKAKIKKKNKNQAKNATKTTPKKQRKKPALKIINLNDHCLIKIFGFLSINDLVNISKISTRFKSCSRSVFTQNFAKDKITVTNEPTSAGQLPSVTLLSNFGNLIKKLEVKCKDEYYRFNNKLEHAILEHCKRTVNEMEFINLDKFALIEIERPFKSVTKVTFIRCVVGKFIFECSKWFPNAQSLELIESKILSTTDVKCVETKFPKVEHLGIINTRQLDEDFSYEYEDPNSLIFQPVFSNINVKAAINLNPQLKSLKLKHNNNDLDHQSYSDDCGIKITPQLLGYISKKLPLLEKLDLLVTQTGVEEQRVNANVLFQNLKTLRFVFSDAITLSHYDISTCKPAKIILIGDELNHSCAEIISKNKNWKKIVLNGHWESLQSYEAVKREVVKCPVLKSVKMSINGLRGCQKEVLALLNECKFLKKLKVCFSTTPWYKLKNENYYHLDSEDKRAAELKLLDTLNLLRVWDISSTRTDSDGDDFFYWMEELGEELSDSGSDNEIDVQAFGRNLPEKLERIGNSFFEMYRNTFDAKRFMSLWQSDYKEQASFYWAIYKKKR